MRFKFKKSKTSNQSSEKQEKEKPPFVDFDNNEMGPDDDDLDEALQSHIRNAQFSVLSDKDPIYQLYHKPSVNHPGIMLIINILRICSGIVTIVLDALIVKEYREYVFIGNGFSSGLVDIIGCVIGIIFLRLQTNCFAIVVLNMDMATLCINIYGAIYSIIAVVIYNPGTLVEEHVYLDVRKKEIAILALCILSMALVVWATCTRYKRKQAEKASVEND